MSLNGDIVIMRNGRSTSQVSIYNYPEHLNPFYEDDQHKRLRFWHIRKGDGEGRRNSFSIGNLKDMWSFKSFRSKKKSSTLGINKTSESPPPLRREYLYASTIDNGFHTYDPRMRHSDTASFQRNAGYRSSLQDMNLAKGNKNGIGFNRNDQYRSTTQFSGAGTKRLAPPPPRRYVYGGSLTPQPVRSSVSGKGNISVLSPGLSQASVSTNPFEEDDFSDDKNVHTNASSPKRNLRKKRKAPAPPDLTQSINERDLTIVDSNELRIIEPTESGAEPNLDISNLTAEIESLVKATNEMTEVDLAAMRTSTPNKLESEKPTNIITTSAQSFPVESATIEIQHMPAINMVDDTKDKKLFVNRSVSPEKTVRKHKVDKASLKVDTTSKDATSLGAPKATSSERMVFTTTTETLPAEGQVECIHVHVESPRRTPESNEPNTLKSFQPAQKIEAETITTKTSFTLSTPPPPAEIIRKETVVVIEKPRSEPACSPLIAEQTNNEIAEVNALKIVEETATKRSITNKPPVAAKPTNLELRTKVNVSPEIHKPARKSLPGPTLNTAVTETQHEEGSKLRTVSTEVLPVGTTTSTVSTSVSQSRTADLLFEETLSSTEQLKTVETPEQAADLSFMPLYRRQPKSPLEWKKSSLAVLETHVPPEKRKSVKDIIESINRSQRLLQTAAQKHQPNIYTGETELATGNTHTLAEGQSSELNNFNKNDDTTGEPSHCPIGNGHALHAVSVDAADDDARKLNNTEICEKFHVNKEMHQLRESSPTSSNLDWNPVPKPKRTKNLSDL